MSFSFCESLYIATPNATSPAVTAAALNHARLYIWPQPGKSSERIITNRGCALQPRALTESACACFAASTLSELTTSMPGSCGSESGSAVAALALIHFDWWFNYSGGYSDSQWTSWGSKGWGKTESVSMLNMDPASTFLYEKETPALLVG